MSVRENWAKSFAEQGMLLFELDNDGDLALFVSKPRPRNDPRDDTLVEGLNCRLPMYHIWRGDKWLMATADAGAAYRRYEEAKKEVERLTFDEYEQLAKRTDPNVRRADMLENGILGLCGETGEVADIYKKFLYQGHDIDYDRIAEELGDCLWYLAQCCRAIGWSLDSVALKNVHKLQHRYPDGFDPERSINREAYVHGESDH